MKNQFLLVTKYDFWSRLLLLCFFDVKNFKVILKAKSAASRLERMCLAQPGYGSELLPPVYNRPNECSIKFYFGSNFP